MHESVYKLRDVVKTRTKGGVSFTLSIPELDIQRGQFIALVGPSGCGKSTLLDMLALVLKPSSWSDFSICPQRKRPEEASSIPGLSENESALIRRKSIGYVLQNGGLLPFLTVRENITLTAELSGARASEQELRELVSTLGLGDQLEKKPQYLSGGQRQRVAVARALIHRPLIILADEPTAAVDYPTALEIRDELRSLAHEAGSAVVMVTHDRSLVQGIADMEISFAVARQSRTESMATVSVKRAEAAAASQANTMRTLAIAP